VSASPSSHSTAAIMVTSLAGVRTVLGRPALTTVANVALHKSATDQQMHKRSDMYNLYFRTPTYVSASKLPSSGFLVENYKNFLHPIIQLMVAN
jgi:hypothetical protein